jgi:nuclear transport factor 2 (NTF2) superfamily protein
MTTRPPLPPFTRESAIQKVRLAEDGWNSRDPEKVALAYSLDSRWRNRDEFVNGREEIIAFLKRKWTKELDYRLIKELWAFTDNRIAVRFAYESRDGSGNWFRSYGNENWEFNEDGLMRLCMYQRSPYQGRRPQIPLAAWPPSGRASGVE